jgi:thiol-disulfide isomerase/thioredoxin
VLASTQGECGSDEGLQSFSTQEVGNQGYLQRHNGQMFSEGRSFSGNERDKLWLNRGDGTWFDLSDLSGCDSPNDGRAVIASDFDGDGDVDLFVHELQRERHSLYRNELGTLYGNFVKLRLRATTGHWEAIGATVTVTTEDGVCALPLSRGAGFVSSLPGELIFGLGPDADEASVRVRWPGGGVDTYTVGANASVTLTEGGEATPFTAPRCILPDPLPPGLKLQTGDVVPALALLDEHDRPAVLDPVALADGGPLYLNLWASYCGPCVAELPLLQRKHASGEARVVALSMDAPADQPKAASLLAAGGTTFPAYYLGAQAPEDGSAAPIEELLDLERLPIPTTLVLDAEGRITEVIRGPLTEDD